jgi:undecaprenyl-diphosphatase
MLEALLKADTQLFLYLNNLGQTPWDPLWLAISSKALWIPLYLFLLVVLAKQFTWRSFGFFVLFIILNLIATDQGSVQLFKEQFMRLRPCHVEALQDQMRTVKEGCGGKFSFISSHASNTFGLALFIGLSLRAKYRWPLYALVAWATLVSYSRVYLGVHYPLDIFCGALYGAFCGTLFYNLHQKYVNPKWRHL